MYAEHVRPETREEAIAELGPLLRSRLLAGKGVTSSD